MTTNYLDHLSHEHPLMLIDDFDSSSIAAPLKCYLCKIPIIGVSATYACSREDSNCSFYLHKKCAESPKHINSFYSLIAEWQLVLNIYHSGKRPVGRVRANGRLANSALCKFCSFEIKENTWTYFFGSYEVCVRCAVMELLLSHEGHQQHSLTLLRREACLKCDACGIKAEEPDSYICHICHYWIHTSCASSPHTIKLRIHEDDTLKLIYSIPEMYQRFVKHCPICRDKVEKNYWSYFCEESGYFVHIKCATKLLASGRNFIEKEDDDVLTYLDLLQFPRTCTSSLVKDLIAQYQSDMQSDTNTIKEKVDDEKEGLVIHHWSHPEHPLILLEELMNADNTDDDIAADDDEEEENHTKNHIDEDVDM
ncbi:hypothetical protein AgCh_035028 [Apium graveolens]